MHSLPTQSRIVLLVAACLVVPCSLLLAQGPLNPPGAPVPTMKTLDQLEPRTPISQLGLTISSGSYYLAANLNPLFGPVGVNGITISGNDVTIDLNGFELAGFASSGAGIFLNGGVTNVTIRNGTIRNWTGHGIDGTGNARVRVENVRVINNGANGIIVDVNGEVLSCVVQGNAGVGIKGTDNCLVENCQIVSTTGSPGTGILLGDSCNVGKCVARSNAGPGISTGNNSVVSNCAAQANVGFGIKVTDNCTIADSAALSTSGAGSQGIVTGNTGVVSGCTARLNTGDNIRVGINSTVVKCSASGSTGGDGINASSGYSLISQCTANFNNQHGINAFQRTRVSDCTANANSQSGVHISFVGTVERCFCNGNTVCGILMDAGGFVDILNNTCSENGVTTSGAGIRVSVASGCRVEGNNVSANYLGIDIITDRNFIGRNFANNNSFGDFSTGGIVNSVGPIVDVRNLGGIGGFPDANHPYANFRY